MGIEMLGGLEIYTILNKLGPRGTAIVGCVSHKFQDWASDDSLWSQFCAQELLLYSPEDHLGSATPSFKAAYQAWRKSFDTYSWSLVIRVRRCWERIKSWLAVNFPEALTTLRKGATEDVINNLETSLNVKLPCPTRVLYRFCDGQNLIKYSESFSTSLLGLIGGYSFCDYRVNVCLLPLAEVIRITNLFRRHLIEFVGVPFGTEFLIVAGSSTRRVKFFLLNCRNGELFVGGRNLIEYGKMRPCLPDDFIHYVHNVKDCQQEDGLLLWLEEHGRRLENGLLNLSEEENSRYISLLPEESSLCYTAVTNGVQVCASAVFIPELSTELRETALESTYYCFAFSIRLSLKLGGCIVNGMRFDSCQLCLVQWIIQESNNIVKRITEETTEWENPLLHPGDEDYVFDGHIFMLTPKGSIKGSLTFVPGRLTHPEGAEFEVELPEFFLEYPDYIF